LALNGGFRMLRRALVSAWAAGTLALTGCATNIDNLPLNQPLAASGQMAQRPLRDIVGQHALALSLSGGGLRASAFALGVAQALAEGPQGEDVYDDLTFISSVSGGSLTAAYLALNGRNGLQTFRKSVLERNFEADLRLSLWSPNNLSRLLAGGLNDRSNLASVIDREVLRGATFGDLYRRGKPDVWINATDLYNRTPFPFIPPVFAGLCSDLSQLRVSEAVAASMAVPLAFTPVVLESFPDRCTTELPEWVRQAGTDVGGVTAGILQATARAYVHYRDPQRMRYVKLADGGLSDNQGLASLLVARNVAGTAHGPLSEADAVRVRQMLFLVVDAGRPPSGDWALQINGPSGIDIGLAAADAAVDSATRLSLAAFRETLANWRDSVVAFRCALPLDRVRRHIPAGQAWRCDDVQFELGVIGFAAVCAAQDTNRYQVSEAPRVLASQCD
jgi:NTE family protein